MKRVILVNGVPASGKSVIARSIAAQLRLPVLSLDAIKEPFFDHLGIGDRDHNRRLGRAAYQAIFAIIREAPAGLDFIVDAWFGFQPRKVLEDYLAAAGLAKPIELWCHAPGAILAERYAARAASRHAGHPGASYVPDLMALAERATPLGLATVIEIDTSQPVDLDALIAHLRRALDDDKGMQV